MLRKIIKIDEEKCTGCGLCASACHEGAIGMVSGKAKLLREDFCDGFGDCLPACPADAIRFEEREAPAYDEKAVAEHKSSAAPAVLSVPDLPAASGLGQWPCQMKLVPPSAPFLEEAHLLIAADCTAFALADIHSRFMRGRVTLVGCTKLDGIDYSVKLSQIFSSHKIRSITVLRMEVPCCGGMSFAVQKALRESGRTIPVRVVTVSTDGKRLDEEEL